MNKRTEKEREREKATSVPPELYHLNWAPKTLEFGRPSTYSDAVNSYRMPRPFFADLRCRPSEKNHSNRRHWSETVAWANYRIARQFDVYRSMEASRIQLTFKTKQFYSLTLLLSVWTNHSMEQPPDWAKGNFVDPKKVKMTERKHWQFHAPDKDRLLGLFFCFINVNFFYLIGVLRRWRQLWRRRATWH